MIISSILNNPVTTCSLCLVCGYFLNALCSRVNQFASKTLKLPIDIQGGLDDEEYSEVFLEANTNLANSNNVSPERQMGRSLALATTGAIQEELTFRFILEKGVLALVSSKPELRMCISSGLFAAVYLVNPYSNEVKAGQVISTAILGLICSLAQNNLGTLAAIFVHVGFNIKGTQKMFSLNFSKLGEVTKAINFEDVIKPYQKFIDDIKIGYKQGHKKALKYSKQN